ncbi:hypothetical protein SAMN05216410_0316 [Sanguibacter gelidistatuariae]|uniref:Excreted virulence factor EspC, type VII ESX diderm n=1 Tax=Sanguibacter gelidistatuariae TaxID=1814289 RepID=A0A1G6GND3_9MICO|nr:hypothetical protein [Sanguibacter gelidistatuariae]SDB83481.1 hypothetical protein SAMN05216410_0316 [Sanguibacter gelidistatuariae]
MAIDVALQALKDDALLWDGVSATLNTASTSASGLSLTAGQLSWAADEIGLVTLYETARSKVEQLLREGSDATGTMADTLVDVKKVYESTDENAQSSLHGTWDPK